ncbi:MAG: tetratricopeptide repeat protein [Lentisphaerae bacterium]|nr:tetratricopeptide repeat protein [Lentisphaerota bacterium]
MKGDTVKSGNTRILLFGMLVLAAGLSAFVNGLDGTFVFDDHVWIVENPAIRALRSSVLYSSRPIVGFTLYLNYAAGGLNPAGYHAVNIGIHLAAGLALFLLVLRTLELSGMGEGRRREWLAVSVAVIWVVHPLNTESVTYVIQRSESLMGLLYLLTLLCFAAGIRNSGRWHSVALCTCAIGMACKPVMVTAPLAVLLYDRFFVSGSVMRAIRGRGAFYLLLACTWLVPLALLSAPHESSTSAGFGAGLVSPARYLAAQPAVIVHYLRIAFWPKELCLDYGWSGAGSVGAILFPSIALALALSATCVEGWRRSAAAYAAAWFFLTLLPTSSVIPIADLAAEHRMYLPLAGIVALSVLGAERFLRGAGTRRGWKVGVSTALLFVLVLGVTIALGRRTTRRNEDYGSRESMWHSVLLVRPGNPRAGFGMGTALLARGDYAGAERHYIAVLEGIPDAKTALRQDQSTVYAMLHNNFGALRYSQGRFAAAERHFREALAVSPTYRDAQRNLGRVLTRKSEQTKKRPR